MTFFEYVAGALRQRDWTIPQFAKRCGVSPQLAYKWLAEDEEARITPGPLSCAKIAAALGVDADYVLELAGHRQPTTDGARPEFDPDLAVVAATWSSLDDGIRRAIRILAGSQPPITGRGRGGITGQSRPGSRDKDGHTRRLTDEKRHLVAAAA